MNVSYILSKVDHTLLSQSATWDEIRAVCDDGLKYGTASVCIPPSYVKDAADYLGGRLPVCTVIGFPNGYSTATIRPPASVLRHPTRLRTVPTRSTWS